MSTTTDHRRRHDLRPLRRRRHRGADRPARRHRRRRRPARRRPTRPSPAAPTSTRPPCAPPSTRPATTGGRAALTQRRTADPCGRDCPAPRRHAASRPGRPRDHRDDVRVLLGPDRAQAQQARRRAGQRQPRHQTARRCTTPPPVQPQDLVTAVRADRLRRHRPGARDRRRAGRRRRARGPRPAGGPGAAAARAGLARPDRPGRCSSRWSRRSATPSARPVPGCELRARPPRSWLWAAWPFHRAAAVNARHGASTMDTLVSLGVLAAYGWSLVDDPRPAAPAHLYFEVAAVVTTFLLAGRYARGPRHARGPVARCARCWSSAPRTSPCCDRPDDGRPSELRVAVGSSRSATTSSSGPARRSPPTASSSTGAARSTQRCSPASRVPVERRPRRRGHRRHRQRRRPARRRGHAGSAPTPRSPGSPRLVEQRPDRQGRRCSGWPTGSPAVFVPVVLGVARR